MTRLTGTSQHCSRGLPRIGYNADAASVLCHLRQTATGIELSECFSTTEEYAERPRGTFSKGGFISATNRSRLHALSPLPLSCGIALSCHRTFNPVWNVMRALPTHVGSRIDRIFIRPGSGDYLVPQSAA